jgi:uncharacterized protein (TIGR02246 family)
MAPLCSLRVLLIATLGLLPPGLASADDLATLKQELEAVNAKFVEYLLKRDAKGLGSLYLDNAVLQFQGAPTVEGRSNIEAYWASAVADGIAAVEVRSDRVLQLAPDTAAQIGTYKLTLPGAKGSAPTIVNGKYGAVYQRHAGEWKVILDTGSE